MEYVLLEKPSPLAITKERRKNESLLYLDGGGGGGGGGGGDRSPGKNRLLDFAQRSRPPPRLKFLPSNWVDIAEPGPIS